MKKYILFPFFLLALSLTLNAQGDLQWLRQLSDVDDDVDVHQMSIDPAGNVYVGGSFDDQTAPQVQFSGVPEAPLNEQNGFIAKYNPSGIRQWISKFGSPNSTTGYSPLAMTESGGFLYVVGSFQFSSVPGLDFDPGAGTTTYQSLSGSGSDFFVSKYNTTTGALVWAYTGGSVSGGADLPRGIVVDNAGDIYVSGYVRNAGTPVDFDIKVGMAASANGIANKKHLYLVKYDANCNFIWRNNILNSSDNSGGSLAYDAVNDFVYMTGGLGDDVGLMPKFPNVGGGLTTLTVNASDDGFIAKYNTSGVLQWVKNVAEGASSNYFWSIDTDNSGNIYVGGVMQGTADFNPGGTRNLTSAGSLDASFAKYDLNGNHLWSYRIGSASFGEECREIRVASTGRIMIAGGMLGVADFNPEGSGGAQNKGVGLSEYIFVGEYTTNFEYDWVNAIGGGSTAGLNYASAALIDDNDPLKPIYVWGYMGTGVTEDFDPKNAGGIYTATGSKDNGFLAKYSTNLTLPIELLSFDAKLNNSVVDLDWVTSSEINNDYFTIQKSKDALIWQDVLAQQGAGNSNMIINYRDVDESPFSGVSYYRLKQTDFDGAFSYSEIRAVNLLAKGQVDVIYTNNVLIINDEDNRNLEVVIFNSIGAVVLKSRLESNRISLSNLATGMYVVNIYNKGLILKTQKISKF